MTKNNLIISNINISVPNKVIIQNLSLTIEKGKTHVLMGPNGSGKSTLAQALMAAPFYSVTKNSDTEFLNHYSNKNRQKPSESGQKDGVIFIGNKDLTDMTADERAREGLFLAFQSPVSIPGVTVMNLLRMAYTMQFKKSSVKYAISNPTSLNVKNAKKVSNRIQNPAFMQNQINSMNIPKFMNKLRNFADSLDLNRSFLDRSIHESFSGGEKKKIELLQALVLEPKFAVFDEIDTGLDVDALKTVGMGIEKLKKNGCGVLIITHYQRILKYIKPDRVHIMISGQIVKNGNWELIKTIEKKGFKSFIKHAK